MGCSPSFAITASAQAEWKILSAESESGRGGIEHRHVIVEDAAAGQRVDCRSCSFLR